MSDDYMSGIKGLFVDNHDTSCWSTRSGTIEDLTASLVAFHEGHKPVELPNHIKVDLDQTEQLEVAAIITIAGDQFVVCEAVPGAPDGAQRWHMMKLVDADNLCTYTPITVGKVTT